MNFISILETIKYIIIIPVFLFWSIYDLLTKTVIVRWQRTLIGIGIIYNFIYLFIDKSIVNDNITGFVICFIIAKVYAWCKKIFTGGDLGGGDVVYFAIVGLFFGTAVGILTIILSFVIFDILLKLSFKIIRRTRSISVAFFPFITCALLIIILIIGESKVRDFYIYLLNILNFESRFIKFF